MKISTRILVSLVLSLIILGACIIGVAYSNTKHNAQMFIEEYKKVLMTFMKMNSKPLWR